MYVFYCGGWAGAFWVYCFFQSYDPPLRPAKEKHDPSQKITWKCVTLPGHNIKLSSNVVPATLWTNITFVFLSKSARCCAVLDQMFLKDLTSYVPNRSQSILSKMGKIRQELTVENVHVVKYGVRDTCLTEWHIGFNVNVEAILKFGPLGWLKMH